jgi:tRNA(Arg) A34 adenosine deaminase TadA
MSWHKLTNMPPWAQRSSHLYAPVGASGVEEKKTKFMQLAIAEAKRARDRCDDAIGAVITQLIGNREVVIASAGNRVKTSGSSIKHVELETLKYVSSGYGRYLPDFVLYSTHEPCAMCAGACVWSKIGAVVFGVSQEDITAYATITLASYLG